MHHTLPSRPESKLSLQEKLRLAASKVEIVREYSEEEVKNLKPDKPQQSSPDVTGHIIGVQGHTPGAKVNSERTGGEK